MSFVHTHLHGEFSLLDGCGTSEMYAERAVALGQSALAITDHGNVAGILYHMEECQARGVKPIIGMEAYFKPDAIAGSKERENWHLLLMAKNLEGYHNLLRLSSAGFAADRFYYKPNIDWDLLSKHSSGLIATSGCLSSYLSDMILEEDAEGAQEVLDRMLAIFGQDFYMEVQPHDIDDEGRKVQHIVNREIVSLAKDRGLPILATIDAHYPFKEWHDTHDALLMINTGQSQKKRKKAEEESKDVMRFDATTFWMMSDEEVRESFMTQGALSASDVEEAMANTQLLADSIESFQIDKTPKVPRAAKDEADAERILREWCMEGLERVGKTKNKVYIDRMDEEIEMFRKLGVLDYFVIIGDMVRWAKSDKPLPSVKKEDPFAKKRPIRVGAGRGSAGASLVLYLTRVTAMDPIGYDLLFQRFMNEFRTELPDVDIDFAHTRRDEVRQYLIETYGQDHVADVISFQSFGMKSVIQAVTRVFDEDIQYAEGIRATGDLDDYSAPEMAALDLESAASLPGHERLAGWRDKYPSQWKHACRLEGQIKGQSKHAAAVVITDEPIVNLMPTMRAKDGSIVTQWSARANAELVSKYGFLKIDLLATEGLTVQQECIDLIKERHGITIDFEDPKQFPEVETPVGEATVVRRFPKGQNLGIFQFGGSGGIIRALREIQPQTIDDLIAANAMYRPGPLQNIPTFAKRKNGQEPWELPHEKAAPVLAKTYGVITFQEQVMQLCIALADFEPSAAAVALKVIAKGVARDAEGRAKLDMYRIPWMEGCARNGIDEEGASLLWMAMLEMASYSFNRAHSAGYALQAYQDMWLKTHYPLEFYAALLKCDPDKAALTVREARSNQIEILPPDINISQDSFVLDGNTIRFGLRGIKHVGEVAGEHILELRPFESLDDWEERIVKKKCNVKVKTALMNCGAFDRWGCRDDMSAEEKAEHELELIGFAPSQPSELAIYKHVLEAEAALTNPEDVEDGEIINVVGEITEVKKHKNKKGYDMAFVKLWYEGDEVESVFWQDELRQFDRLLKEGRAVLMRGKWQEERMSLRVFEVMGVREFAEDVTSEAA
jgi:DNA polymerase-3 subunit alpha